MDFCSNWVSLSFQWVANDGTSDTDIAGATDSTYTLVDADEGRPIKVKVSFTDDADNEETLTSAASAAVDAVPLPPLTVLRADGFLGVAVRGFLPLSNTVETPRRL